MIRMTAMTLMMAAATMVGCDTTPRNEGRKDTPRIDSRQAGEGTRLGSQDLTVASEKAVVGIANLPAIKSAEGRTVIVMDRVANRTSDPSQNFQIYLARIRALLNQSGAKHDLVFVETRTVAEDIKAREGIAAGPQNRTPPRYALAGTFYDLPRARTNYHLLTFQLVDLTSDEITWEDQYEVKLRD